MYDGTNIDNSVTIVYTGSGLTATLIFNIDTSSPFSNKYLKLGCQLPGTTTIVYSSNTLAFTVTPCILTGISPRSNSYTYI